MSKFTPHHGVAAAAAAATTTTAVFVVVASVVYLATSGAHAISLQLADERWKEYHYKIYATVSAADQIEQLEPGQTRAMLAELATIYAPYTEEQTNGRKLRVQVLLEASNVSMLHCHRDRFVSYDKLLDYNQPYKLNLVPYIRHHRRLQFELCHEHVIDLMYHELNHNLGQQYREDMPKLAEFIETTPPKRGRAPLGHERLQQGTPEEFLVAGIVEFLRHKLGFLDVKLYREKPNGRMRFNADLNAQVFDMCRAWVEAMEPVFTMLEMEAPLALTPDESQWLLYSDICRNIFKMAPEVYKSAYKRVRRLRWSSPPAVAPTAVDGGGGGGGHSGTGCEAAPLEKQALERIWHKPNYHRLGAQTRAFISSMAMDSSLLGKFWKRSKQVLQCKLLMKKSCLE